MELLSSNIKKISGNGNPEKNSYIFSKKSFSYISGNISCIVSATDLRELF